MMSQFFNALVDCIFMVGVMGLAVLITLILGL
jgi:hypothetical protein